MASFETDIRPMFREADVQSMRWMFDLHDHEDVTENAEAILSTVESGSMPCDSRWPAEQVALLRQWIADGCPA